MSGNILWIIVLLFDTSSPWDLSRIKWSAVQWMGNLRQSKYDRSMKLSTVFSSSAAVLEFIKPVLIAVVGCSIQMYMCVFTYLATLNEVCTLSNTDWDGNCELWIGKMWRVRHEPLLSTIQHTLSFHKKSDDSQSEQ